MSREDDLSCVLFECRVLETVAPFAKECQHCFERSAVERERVALDGEQTLGEQRLDVLAGGVERRATIDEEVRRLLAQILARDISARRERDVGANTREHWLHDVRFLERRAHNRRRAWLEYAQYANEEIGVRKQRIERVDIIRLVCSRSCTGGELAHKKRAEPTTQCGLLIDALRFRFIIRLYVQWRTRSCRQRNLVVVVGRL